MPNPHTTPQPPQFVRSLVVSTQTSPHSAAPLGQGPEASMPASRASAPSGRAMGAPQAQSVLAQSTMAARSPSLEAAAPTTSPSMRSQSIARGSGGALVVRGCDEGAATERVKSFMTVPTALLCNGRARFVQRATALNLQRTARVTQAHCPGRHFSHGCCASAPLSDSQPRPRRAPRMEQRASVPTGFGDGCSSRGFRAIRSARRCSRRPPW